MLVKENGLPRLPDYVHFRLIKHTFTFVHLTDAFIQSDLQWIQVIYFFVSLCVPWELNWPQKFTIKCCIPVDIDNYYDKCQTFISFKFKGRFLLQSES